MFGIILKDANDDNNVTSYSQHIFKFTIKFTFTLKFGHVLFNEKYSSIKKFVSVLKRQFTDFWGTCNPYRWDSIIRCAFIAY